MLASPTARLALTLTLGSAACIAPTTTEPPACGADEFGDDCVPVSACGPDAYETAAPTPSTDRQCAPLTVCTADEYEAEASSATTDRVCDALTVCGPDEVEQTPPTPTSDRVCVEVPPVDLDLDFAGAYRTETETGVVYSPLVLDDDGGLTIAGHPIDYAITANDEITWEDQTINGERTAGTLTFLATAGGDVLAGTVRTSEDAEDVTYTGFEDPLMRLVGAYDTITSFGYRYTPLVIRGDGTLTIADEDVAFTYDPAGDDITWEGQEILGNTTAGDLRFTIDAEGIGIAGSVRPRAQDGPVSYTGELQAVMDFVGTYDAATGFGFPYTPLVIRQTGEMTIAGWDVSYAFAGDTDTMTWSNQIITDNTTTGDIDFAFGTDGVPEFDGTVRPRAQDGPVYYRGQARH